MSWTNFKIPKHVESLKFHSMVSNGPIIYIIGGKNKYELVTKTLYSFNTQINEWKTLKNLIKPVMCHRCIIKNDKIYIFGGCSRDIFMYDEIFCYSILNDEWNVISTTGDVMKERIDHSCVELHDKVFIFGGLGIKGILRNDLMEFDLIHYHWRKIECNNNIVPTPMCHHSSVIFNSKLFIFGGVSLETLLNEFWEFNFVKNSWNKLETPKMISPMKGNSFNICDGIGYIFGGDNDSMFLNEFYSFDFSKCKWETLDFYETPFPRCFHSSCVSNNELFIFGGVSTQMSDRSIYKKRLPKLEVAQGKSFVDVLILFEKV
jgi:N-acetylneuraminic acid mutarotase